MERPARVLLVASVFGAGNVDDDTKSMVRAVSFGLATGYAPALAFDGSGGTYFMKDRNGWEIAVFKPQDEEPYAPHNVSSM